MGENLKHFLQKIRLINRDESFWKQNHDKLLKNLRNRIIAETPWLAGTTLMESKSYSLPFHDQAIKYYEYKNMKIQRRAQYVIIFLTLALLIMTGLQIYLTFFG